tara:strand:+ start:2798 stop:3523 length:726 start_codon:yes stop_codon:yes gene_type:complete
MKLLDNIEKLAYGNLNRENLQYIEQDSLFNNYIDVFFDNPYPNLSETEKEIDFIIDIQNSYMTKPNWKKYKRFMQECDDDIKQLLKRKLNEIGLKWTNKCADLLEKIQSECGSLIMHLKRDYNRARPFQMAYYTGQDLHPFNTISGQSPAYPSGHAFQSRFLLKIVAFNYPQYKDKIKKLAEDIAFTRIVMGVHYPSDNKFGFEIADKLATYPQIRDKYFTRKIFNNNCGCGMTPCKTYGR